MDKTQTTTRKIYWARCVLGLTQRECARLSGVSANSIQNYEKGRGSSPVAVYRLRQLCRALQRHAAAEGYDPAQFDVAVLCPDLAIPEPAKPAAEDSR